VDGHANLSPLVSQYFAGLSIEVEEPDPELLERVVQKAYDIIDDTKQVC
jgi:hypothetical protein